MNLFVNKFKTEFELYKRENIKVVFSGRRENLRNDVLEAMDKITEETKNNTKGVMNFCLNYGGQYEMIDAVKKIIEDGIDVTTLTPDLFMKYCYQDLPPIDLMIRTSGECRISNFMLYQMAYAELYFTDTYFPDFDIEAFKVALSNYQGRNRRFGGLKNEDKNS